MDFQSEPARLAEPIAPDAPCGESLEDTPALARSTDLRGLAHFAAAKE